MRLIGDGHAVASISRGRYVELENAGVKCYRADICEDLSPIGQAFEDANAVFHTASKVEMWGDYDEFFKVNVCGTRNIIKACQKFKVPKLIYTSSPSVIADGTNLRGVDESYPYPKRFEAHYPATKAQAEREVLQANSESLYTAALRPHMIWGPGDTHLTATVLERARAGRLMRVGGGKNIVDFSFIDDCVQAHIDATGALDRNSASRGRAYFVSQGEPVSLWGWIDEVLERNGLPRIKRSLPYGLAKVLACGCEAVAKLRSGSALPLLTRFLVFEMATDHYFDISAAKRELGYAPRWTMAAAMDRTFPRSNSAL